MAVKKLCVLGLGKAGVPLSAVIAYKCPEIRVSVVKASAEDIFRWSTGKIPHSVPGLEELIRKCQNKNLVFTTNEVLAIKEAEIIFIVSDSRLKSHGEGQDRAVDLSAIEETAYLIAEHSESNKIVVENSFIPLKSAECLTNVFRNNGRPGVEFQVLSSPEFYEYGTSVRTLLLPEYVLIGCENSSKGLAATKKLVSIYERWVPHENIITRMNWSVELSKIAISVMAGQAIGSMYAMCAICEDSGGDIVPVMQMVMKNSGVVPGFPSFGCSIGKYTTALQNLVYMCEFMDLGEVAEYWRQVLEMFSLHRSRFSKRFFWALRHTWNRRIAVVGFASFKDSPVTDGSAAIDLCKAFLEENALVNVYDPKVTKQQVIEDLVSSGCTIPKETLEKSLWVYDDPYKATCGMQVVVTWGGSDYSSQMDFQRVFGEMVKPAYVFDTGQNLDQQQLSKIGFLVHSVGKSTN